MKRKMRDYSLIDWSEYFEVSVQSPSGLTWKDNFSRGRYKGSIAGNAFSVNGEPKGWRVKLQNSYWLIPRILFIMAGVNISDKIIDHIDGNPFNNQITNLRVTTIDVNNKNKKIGRNNSSGVMGVSRHITPTGKSYFRVAWTINNMRKTKYFSIDKFGIEAAFEMACLYRKVMINNLNTNGDVYSSRHGCK